jgi:hypothetical protein
LRWLILYAELFARIGPLPVDQVVELGVEPSRGSDVHSVAATMWHLLAGEPLAAGVPGGDAAAAVPPMRAAFAKGLRDGRQRWTGHPWPPKPTSRPAGSSPTSLRVSTLDSMTRSLRAVICLSLLSFNQPLPYGSIWRCCALYLSSLPFSASLDVILIGMTRRTRLVAGIILAVAVLAAVGIVLVNNVARARKYGQHEQQIRTAVAAYLDSLTAGDYEQVYQQHCVFDREHGQAGSSGDLVGMLSDAKIPVDLGSHEIGAVTFEGDDSNGQVRRAWVKVDLYQMTATEPIRYVFGVRLEGDGKWRVCGVPEEQQG